MDKNYEDRIEYRRGILQEHHDIVVAVNDDIRINPAVKELYNFLFGTYLPERYPTMFKLHTTEYEQGTEYMLQNLITNELFPARPKSTTKTMKLLETMGKQIDEDFLLLLPEENGEKDPKYVLEAFITICPSGFNPREKLGKRLSDIHEPVPAYGERLESSMDRFFAKLEAGKYVKRVNWSITTGAELYAAGDGTTHAHKGDEVMELEEIDVDQVARSFTIFIFKALTFGRRTFDAKDKRYTACPNHKLWSSHSRHICLLSRTSKRKVSPKNSPKPSTASKQAMLHKCISTSAAQSGARQ